MDPKNIKDMGEALRKGVWKGVVILALGIVIGTLLQTLAYMLPVNEDNRDASYRVLEKEGWYPRASVNTSARDEYFFSFYPDVLDNGSDSVILYTAMDTSGGNPLVRAMNSYSEYAKEYSYYWHGYVSVLRPLLLLFDFSEIRILNGVCQISLLILLAYLIGQEKNIRYVFALVTSYVLLNPQALSMGFQFSWVFYIAYGGTFVLLKKRNFFSQKSRYLCFFIGIGMLTSYFDLLTYPLFTWGFPLIWWIVTERREQKETEWLKCVILSGAAWIVGYACMWAAKWGIATLVLGKNIFESAIEEILFRSGTAGTGEGCLAARGHAAYLNWKHYGYIIYEVILAGWLIWWVCCSLRKKWEKSSKRYALFLIGISSVVWYFVLSNHTLMHHFFTHRIYGVSILAFLALILESMGNFRENAERAGREKAVMFGALVASMVLACFGILFIKEEISVTNNKESFQRIRMDEGLEMEFVPTYNITKHIDLGLECDSEEGRYEIKVWEGDKLKYQTIFPLKDKNGVNYQRITTWWVLKHGKNYRITVDAVGTGAPVFVWVTDTGDTVLPELSEASLGGTETGGKILMGLCYLGRHYASGEIKFFVWLSWVGIFMVGAYVLAGTKISTKNADSEISC